jgi:hypothetical protein
MKKIIIALSLCFVGYPMFAQLPFVSFQSVQADPVQRKPPVNNNAGSLYDPLGLSSGSTVQTPPPPQQNTNYTTIQAYTIKNGQFHKTKIKVLEKGNNIYVNSYYDRNSNIWYNAYNTTAQKTTQYDPDVIYNNFDYKVNISGVGYVYF